MHFETVKIKRLSLTVLATLVVFSFGVYIGTQNRPEIEKVTGLGGKDTTIETTADFSPFWKVWNTLNEKNPDARDVSDQNKVYNAISGLVDSLNDPYSVFFKPDQAKIFQEDISGNFTGVGMEVGMKNKVLTVISPLKDTPAYKAGIKSGDKILMINETSTVNMSIDEAIKMIRGEKGTTVTLSIFREGYKEPKEFKIVRDVINTPVIDTELRGDGIFVIRLYNFSANSAPLFRDALQKFSDAKTDKLLLDLRGNPGGYLDAAVSMSSWFLPAGKPVVIEDYGNGEEQNIFRSKGYNIFNDKLKFVILIDGGSASASEIFAGAMQDYKKAVLVGEKSYGKGSVQEVIKITPDTLLKVTVAKWLTPNGVSISQKGLAPDYEVTAENSILKLRNDPQMDKAVEILNAWSKIVKK